MTHTAELLAAAPGWFAAGDFQRVTREMSALCEREPDNARAHFLRGAALHAQGRPDAALAAFERACALAPQDVEARSACAATLHALGRLEQAAQQFAHAIAMAPRSADLHVNHALVLEDLARPAQALDACRQALALQPDHARALQNVAVLLSSMGRLDEALEACRTLLRHHPRHAQGHANLGNLLLARHDYEAALAASTRAVELAPDLARAHADRALALATLGRFDAARAAARRAVSLAPDIFRTPASDAETPVFPDPRVVYLVAGHERLERCDWHDFERQCEVFADIAASDTLAIDLNDQMGLLFRSYVLPVAPELRARLAERTGRRLDARAGAHIWVGGRERRAGERLRIGYLSADYGAHPGALLLLPALLAHDRTQFEISAFALNPDDGSRQRVALRAAVDRFIELHDVDDDHEAAWRIHEAGCDVLVFREGYTRRARPGILAHRPVPLQLTWAGYHGTLGGGLADYHVSEPVSDPPAESALWSESRLFLPYGPFPFPHAASPAPAATPRAVLGLPETALVFAALHRAEKIDPLLFAAWMRLLAAVPGSVLWLQDDNVDAREALRAHAARNGVDPARLHFAQRVDIDEHLARLAAADVWLDTRWYGSHTTLLDALAAGVPAVTCTGNAVQGRIGAALLHAAGLPEFVTHRIEDYEASALRLAVDAKRRARLRAALRARTAPLFDVPAFVRTLETGYRIIWQRHRQGLPAADLTLSAEAYGAPPS